MSENDSQIRRIRRHFRQFFRLFGLLRNHETPCGEPLNVSRAHAMMVLLEEDEGLRISELGEKLNIDESNVSRLCTRMEEEGHVVRRPSPEDGRAKELHLTEEGRRLARRIDEASLERFARLVETLEREGEERERVLDVLASLNNALHTAFHEEETNES